VRTPDRVEWPTVALVAGFWIVTVAAIAGHASIPWFASVPLLALLGGLHFSLQHEAIHGHPTPWHRVNTALVGVPLALWCPYAEYRDSHLAHHDSDLTVPGADPESWYVSETAWASAGPLRRAALWTLRTAPGRLLLGPLAVVTRTLVGAARAALHAAPVRRTWAVHLALIAAIAGFVFGVAGLPAWEYLVGWVWGGTALTLLRSFVEHRAVADGTRSAVVRTNPVLALLFLNNNLHHAHHAEPGLAWYRLPALADRIGADDAARRGAGWYPGYGAVLRRHLVRPFDAPAHPRTGS
jgi:fatty acid desaturase